MSATQDKTYNGWTNYETWAVGMFLDGNYDGEGTYLEVLNITRATSDHVAVGTQVREGIWTEEQGRRFYLADNLKSFVEESLPEAEGLTGDLVRAAISEVNWDELAEHKLSELDES